jgi:ricin-type beta-trefoil lectin protein/putative Ig domain-containing protein
MFKRIFAVAAAASLSVLGGTAAAQAQAQSHARPAGHLHGVRVVNLHRAYEAQLGHTRVGKISGIVYAKGHRPKATANAAAATCTEPACPVAWQGGTVQHTPHVYLLFWGPNWTTDPAQEASATYLENFFSGLGNGQADDTWSTITSQYADATGSPGFSGLVNEPPTFDTSAPPKDTSLVQIGAEADTFAQNAGITDLNDAQIIVATQSGTCPQGYLATGCTGGTLPRNECGYHSSSNQAFINLPYVLDAGTSCGKDAVNPTPGGDNDGWSIVGGDLYASTITDPFPPTGWVDPTDGSEISGKCSTGFDLTLATSATPFAVQQQWSNAANACVPTGAIKDTIKITSPGSPTSSVGISVNLAIVGSSTAGNPLTWSATGLPAGLNINASTGTVTGTPTTAGTFGVTVAATDETGAKRSVSFNWTINTAKSGPIKGDHGKCLDDFGGSTTNGNKVDIWTCNNTTSQKWTFSGGELSVLGKCLDDSSQGGAGAKLVVWTCNGHAAQTWTHKSNGEYVLKLNGLCLTDPSGSATNGTQVVIRKCAAFADQTWTLP